MSREKRVNDLPPRRRVHYWLLVVPFVWQLALAPYVNDVVIRGCPIPFPMVWQMMGVVLASATIAAVFRIDRCYEAAQIDDPPDRLEP
jgi:Protein of unknown function (DUF3311)